MYCVYIIENQEGSHYVGYSSDLRERIKGHNSSKSKWTRKKGPWHLVYKEEFQTKQEAFLRERKINKFKGGEAFKKLIPE